MTVHEFKNALEVVMLNLRGIRGVDVESERYKGITKIIGTIDEFNLNQNEDGTIKVYYENKIEPIQGLFKGQDIVLPLILLYTDVWDYTERISEHLDMVVRSQLSIQRKTLGSFVRQVCIQNFKECSISREKVMEVSLFVKRAIPQLHHIAGHIGEVSHTIIPKDSEELKGIREVYENFKVGRNYINFYDPILEKMVRIEIDSPKSAYAIGILFCNAYVTSLAWLRKNYPDGQWCPITVWEIISDFKVMHTQLY